MLQHDAAPPGIAAAHFRNRLSFEADCADVFADLRARIAGFAVIDTRSPALYEAGHIPGAVNIPHRRLSAAALTEHGIRPESVLVTYCAGPHCNAATRGALRLSEMGLRVKEMPGGLLGWVAEGFPLATGPTPSSVRDQLVRAG